MKKYTLSSWLEWFALLPAGLFTGLWLLMGMRELSAGDLGDLSHLLPALLIVFLVLVASKWPRQGAIALLVAGAALFLYLLAAMQSPESRLPGALLTGGPFLLSGMLFLLADRTRRPIPVRG